MTRGLCAIACLLAAATPFVGGAHAQGAGELVTAEQAIAFLDRDGDGRCSLQEYLAFHAVRMKTFDTSGDDALSLAEFRESLQGQGRKNADRSFRAFNNEDKPRALTQREFLGYHAYVFKNFADADNDGYMSGDEWAKLTGR